MTSGLKTFTQHCGSNTDIGFDPLGLAKVALLGVVQGILSSFAILVYLAAAIAVNAVFGTNFGYLMTKPTQPSLLDFLAPWPYYIGEMMLLGGGFIIFLYSPFLILDRLARSRNASS